MDNNLEIRLRELVDRQDIWTVLVRYGRGLDRMDRAMLRGCYWDDAIEDHHGFVGTPDAFIDWAYEFNQGATVHHHGIGNHYCTIDGDDAHAETYYTFIGAMPGGQNLLSMGRYIDHFQRRGGEWRFANRVTVIEKNFALSDHAYDAMILAGDITHGPLKHASRDNDDLSYERPVKPRQPEASAA